MVPLARFGATSVPLGFNLSDAPQRYTGFDFHALECGLLDRCIDRPQENCSIILARFYGGGSPYKAGGGLAVIQRVDFGSDVRSVLAV
jgi:hypothetical protein